MPRLEILRTRPRGKVRATPLLFVHGAFAGAWIWQAKFLPFLAERGWIAAALSLSGHGGSDGRDQLDCFGLAQYAEDVLEAAQSLPRPPVVIGHSMGGMVVQRALVDFEFPGAVLMASVPPHGLWESSLRLALRDPYLLQQMGLLMLFGAGHADLQAVRRVMFSDAMPEREAYTYEPFLQEESRRITMELAGYNPFPLLPSRRVPVAVFGAENDALVPQDQVSATARVFRTQPRFFKGMGHAMMLEPGWEEVAMAIESWVEATFGEEAERKAAE